MPAAPLPHNEEKRLQALEEFEILDSPAEDEFDDLAALAAHICGTPVALISLVDRHRQWFKSKIGIDAPETPREMSFCAHALLEPEKTLIVPNTREDERFADNPLVTGDEDVQFYAGTPLVTSDGFPIGTLCTIDHMPRNLTPAQTSALQRLGRQVINQMELRINVRRLRNQIQQNQRVEAKLQASNQQVVDLLEGMNDGFIALNHRWQISYVNQEGLKILGKDEAESIELDPKESLPRGIFLNSHVLGQLLWEVMPKKTFPNLEESCRQAVTEQVGVTFETFQQQTHTWYEVRVFPAFEGISLFFQDVSKRKAAQKALDHEKQRVDSLLLNILPQPIAELLKRQPQLIAERHDNVTILFADLVNFTTFSRENSPEEVVSLLNKVFSAFDQLSLDLGLEKIKTIGDAYMVVGGLPLERENHAEAIADLAFAMMSYIELFNQENFCDLQLRIGFNSGSVIAGVIGMNKFSYDLWGDAVNIASRMESQGLPGKIQVTQSTYELLRHKYLFESRGEIQIKGSGLMQTYWLQG
ncbi:MAG: adenylate/guanylate cyclase domain-containing protein [Limnothrix sp.]